MNGCSLSCTSSNEFAGVDFLLVERSGVRDGFLINFFIVFFGVSSPPQLDEIGQGKKTHGEEKENMGGEERCVPSALKRTFFDQLFGKLYLLIKITI